MHKMQHLVGVFAMLIVACAVLCLIAYGLRLRDATAERAWNDRMDASEAAEDQAEYDASLRALAWPDKWERRARASRCFLYRGTVKDGLDDDF